MSSLNGARVALLEARMSSELADLIRRYGGEPLSAPAVREHALESGEQVDDFINHLSRSLLQVVVFLTGVGAMTLFREAERLGRLPELLTALKSATTVCRGPKPTAALKRTGVQISLGVREPYTTTEILEAMTELDLKGKGVAVVHYGERNVMLTEALRSQGALLEELCLYEWLMPEDLGPLKNMVQEIINGRIDAVAFTSQIQVRHLFQVAADLGQSHELAQAMKTKTVVAAVGPTCAASLQELGVMPQVVPEHPKMVPMIVALADYVEQRGRRSLST